MNNEDHYKNREIDEKVDGLHEKLDLILDQTTKTNGRVSKLENERWFLRGGMVIIMAIVIPLVVYIWNTNNSDSIQKGIERALSAYDVQIQ